MKSRFGPAGAALAVALAAGGAYGQQQGAPAGDGDTVAAAQAFEQGTRAQLRGEHARAADLFELADRSAPSPVALRAAIRNHDAAGHYAVAATLALRAQERYPSDRDTQRVAQAVLTHRAPRLGRIRVRCTPGCGLTIDRLAAAAGAVTEIEVFADPGEHAVGGSWAERPAVTRTVSVTAGGTAEVTLEAPPAPERAPDPPAQPQPQPAPVVAQPPVAPPRDEPAERPRGLSPVFVGVGAGLTVVSAVALVVSGLDTLAARDVYVMDPTEERFNDGVGRQTRTNVLIAATVVLGAATVVLAAAGTDWGGGRARRAQATARLIPGIAPAGGGAIAGLSYSF